MTPMLAWLKVDGDVRMVCCGCSQILHHLGLVRIIHELPMPVAGVPAEAFGSVTYEMMPHASLKLCRSAVKTRHVGAPWGANILGED